MTRTVSGRTLIGESAGAKLIHEAATAYIKDYFIRQEKPFSHLTFLDAYTLSDWDKDSYGSLPTDYPNHYSEHYIHRTESVIGPWTNSCLLKAFDFDITNLQPVTLDEKETFGHHWPRYWYVKSINSIIFPPKFGDGFPLSLEGGNDRFGTVAGDRPAGQQCSLSDVTTSCAPAPCW